MDHSYGVFCDKENEFVVTRPDTPRAFDNFIWNRSVFSNVQQTGIGCFDYQVQDKEAIQLFTGVGRICHYDVFGRDHLMSRIIYIRDKDTGEYWNINWEPVYKPYGSYRCAHGLENCKKAYIEQSQPLRETGVFLEVKGDQCRNIILSSNNLVKADKMYILSNGADDGMITLLG